MILFALFLLAIYFTGFLLVFIIYLFEEKDKGNVGLGTLLEILLLSIFSWLAVGADWNNFSDRLNKVVVFKKDGKKED